MNKELTCINCPIGCHLIIELDQDQKPIQVTGNRCIKGKEYAIQELSEPKRMLTTTMRVINGEKPLVSVRTSIPIAKDLIFQVMDIIDNTKLKAPIMIGDILIPNILRSNVDIIATSNNKLAINHLDK
ncbi:MAG: DUF1667 domain-containing protein [Erysipelotrichaceae bacterium]|nr:DUF1667 domain-containing protein [Erysipelotrichaceae bacterium]MDD3923818.1 DUF1667 domain-containing protein [Erysipelotrichaceae bacterium]MDD4641895.1 DUF1667 domain-containing protein [Erysipelotrichaceae bacterium]